MVTYDLCVAWNWVYDADFVSLLELSCRSLGLSMLQITPGNLPQMLSSLASGEVSCRAFFDRASDDDPQFLPLIQFVSEDFINSINSYELASRTWDKAEVHSLLVSHEINVPRTIILPPYIDQPELASVDLLTLGDQFTIKPAHGSGGVGVMTNATSWDQVLAVRREHATDHYLLQAHVAPMELDLRPAWFRVIYCTGQVFPCWWNPYNHVYTPVSPADMSCYKLETLEKITSAIANIFELELFSTEIAAIAEDLFVVVDYVNDQIDLRLQSISAEGVPDEIVRSIAERLASYVAH